MARLIIVVLALSIVGVVLGIVALILAAIGYVPLNPSGSDYQFLVANSKRRKWTDEIVIPDGFNHLGIKHGVEYGTMNDVNTSEFRTDGTATYGQIVNYGYIYPTPVHVTPVENTPFFRNQDLTNSLSVTDKGYNPPLGLIPAAFANEVGFAIVGNVGGGNFTLDTSATSLIAVQSWIHDHQEFAVAESVTNPLDLQIITRRTLHFDIEIQVTFSIATGQTAAQFYFGLKGQRWGDLSKLIAKAKLNKKILPLSKASCAQNSTDVSFPNGACWVMAGSNQCAYVPEEDTWGEIHFYVDDTLRTPFTANLTGSTTHALHWRYKFETTYTI